MVLLHLRDPLETRRTQLSTQVKPLSEKLELSCGSEQKLRLRVDVIEQKMEAAAKAAPAP